MSNKQQMIGMLRYPEQNNGVYLGDFTADLIDIVEQHLEGDEAKVEIDELESQVKRLEDDLEEARYTITDLENENRTLRGDNYA